MDFSITKEKTALVVIDLQKGIVARKAEPHESVEVVARAAKLAEAFRKHRMPVFLVRVTPSEDLKDRLEPLTDSPTLPASVPQDFAELVPELGRQHSDFIITKRQWGAFYGTELDLELRRRRIDTIVLCGISTNIGVESTARCAYERGYNQIFVEDAMSAQTKAEHEHALRTVFPRMGRVRMTKEVLSALS